MNFDEAWKAVGYNYGEEELESVRLGWELCAANTPRIEWIDAWDCKHSMSADAAAIVLKAYTDEWPGGQEEIEACINMWKNKFYSLAADYNEISTDGL
jgi:hypothetical protein